LLGLLSRTEMGSYRPGWGLCDSLRAKQELWPTPVARWLQGILASARKVLGPLLGELPLQHSNCLPRDDPWLKAWSFVRD
jgi:hypothetical protein